MSKVDPPPTAPYVESTFVTADQIVKHYGVTAGETKKLKSRAVINQYQ